MGRPSLGNQARTIQQSTKISKDELVWLEGLHGSAHKGLRAALDLYKLEQMRSSNGEPEQDYAAALADQWVPPAEPARPIVDVELPVGPRPVVPVDEDGTPIPCRIHKVWEYLGEPYYDKGVQMREKRCTKCGHLVVERVK